MVDFPGPPPTTVPVPAWTRRLASLVAVHPNGPTAVSDGVAADLAVQARRRARGLAWAGLLVNLPLFYVDDYINLSGGVLADPGSAAVGFLVWRIVAVATLGGYLWAERRAPRGPVPDRRWASALAVWFIVLGGWFGKWFLVNDPSYALYGLTLLVVAVLIHAPSRARLLAYPGAMAIALGGALLDGAPPLMVLEWTALFVILTVFAVFVDRALYLQAYRNAESARLLARANAEQEATLVELRETQGRLVEAERQAERTRISRDLHDSVGAQLSSLLAGIELARLREGAPLAALTEVEDDAREAMRQLREVVWVLNAREVTVDALATQLRRFAEARARSAGIDATVTATGERDAVVPAAAALQLYRVGQEAVQNAVKHSGAATIVVRLASADGRLALSVRDDGAFRPPVAVIADGAPSGFGMASMRERTAALGGTFDLSAEAGTEVRIDVPLGAGA